MGRVVFTWGCSTSYNVNKCTMSLLSSFVAKRVLQSINDTLKPLGGSQLKIQAYLKISVYFDTSVTCKIPILTIQYIYLYIVKRKSVDFFLINAVAGKIPIMNIITFKKFL